MNSNKRRYRIENLIKPIFDELALLLTTPLICLLFHQQKFYFKYLPWVILVVALLKILIYLFQLLERIENYGESKVYNFRQFIFNSFSVVFLVNVSFSIDYFCINHFHENSFHGLSQPTNDFTIFLELFYFSVVTFATVGYGDIYPIILSVRILVVFEIFTAFSLVVFILANFDKIRDSSSR
jgi:Ion channel